MNKENKIMLGGFALGIVALLCMGMIVAVDSNGLDLKENDSARIQQKQDIAAAINNSDYNAWVAAMSKNGRHPKILDKINESNFPTYVAFLNAIKNRDFTTARTLGDSLGLKTHQKLFMKGYKQGIKEGLKEGMKEGRHMMMQNPNLRSHRQNPSLTNSTE